MKAIFLFPIRSIMKNKGQSLSILLSMVLSVALIVSVSCLMYSAQRNKTESNRVIYGDYHYYLLGDDVLTNSILEKKKTKGYTIQNVQEFELRDVLEETNSFNLVLSYANKDCRKMIQREIIEGKYPENKNEIAMDRYTLRALDAEDSIGKEISFRNKTFILSGIIEDPAQIDNDALEVYVSENYENNIGGNIIYLKFDENKQFYDQISSFVKEFDIKKENLESNGVLINGLIDGNIEQFINTIRMTAEDDEANFITLLMKLQADVHMTSGLVSTMLAIFSIFIIYSIFDVSVLKRIKEYGILQTIGVGRNTILLMLFFELLLLFAVSYPLGVLGGIVVDKILYANVGSLFSGKVSIVERMHNGILAGDTDTTVDIIVNKFYIDNDVIMNVAVFLLVLLIVISFILAIKVQRKTIIDLMNPSTKSFYKGKIYSLKEKSLLTVLTNQFMFRRIKSFIGVIISLSIGGVMILSTNYLASNSRLNSEMVLNTDNDLSSDIRISLPEGNFDYGITEEQLHNIANLPEISSSSVFKFFLGEMSIQEDQLKWKEYWAEIAGDPNWKQTPNIMSRFNGIITASNDGYKIKTNIYGYGADSLDKLKDYVLDGSIDLGEMNQKDTVILRTIVDAQNNANGLDIKAGDTIFIRVPKKLNGNEELLRFQDNDEQYEEKEFVVSAIVRKSLINNTAYIADEGLDIIMTNEEMSKFFQIENYNMITINSEQKDNTKVVSQLQQLLKGTTNVQIVDNTISIQAKNQEYKRAEMLIYSIALILIAISLFHIMNTMFHLLHSRRYAFTVLRAMGITEHRFYIMLIIQAFKYGLITCLTVLLVYYLLVQRILANMLVHVYGYLNNLASISIVTLFSVVIGIVMIFIVSISIPSRRILEANIVEELK